MESMANYNLGNNCYRAILAQVNYLDGIWPEKNRLKDLYEELTELAFYMLEQDYVRVTKGIEQIYGTIDELESLTPVDQHCEQVSMIFSELRTHLNFLKMEYNPLDRPPI